MRTELPQIVELYEIIADTVHTLTTSREPVLWRGAEWTPAAILFAGLIFSLTAPTYIWTILGI